MQGRRLWRCQHDGGKPEGSKKGGGKPVPGQEQADQRQRQGCRTGVVQCRRQEPAEDRVGSRAADPGRPGVLTRVFSTGQVGSGDVVETGQYATRCQPESDRRNPGAMHCGALAALEDGRLPGWSHECPIGDVAGNDQQQIIGALPEPCCQRLAERESGNDPPAKARPKTVAPNRQLRPRERPWSPDGNLHRGRAANRPAVDRSRQLIGRASNDGCCYWHAEQAGKKIDTRSRERQVEPEEDRYREREWQDAEDDHRRQVRPARLRICGKGRTGQLERIPSGDLQCPQLLTKVAIPRVELGRRVLTDKRATGQQMGQRTCGDGENGDEPKRIRLAIGPRPCAWLIQRSPAPLGSLCNHRPAGLVPITLPSITSVRTDCRPAPEPAASVRRIRRMLLQPPWRSPYARYQTRPGHFVRARAAPIYPTQWQNRNSAKRTSARRATTAIPHCHAAWQTVGPIPGPGERRRVHSATDLST